MKIALVLIGFSILGYLSYLYEKRDKERILEKMRAQKNS